MTVTHIVGDCFAYFLVGTVTLVVLAPIFIFIRDIWWHYSRSVLKFKKQLLEDCKDFLDKLQMLMIVIICIILVTAFGYSIIHLLDKLVSN